jgi:triphosphoribosyl-dephospho-CoA synthase
MRGMISQSFHSPAPISERGRSRAPAPPAPKAIAMLAIGALFDELALYPKPGLVSFRNAGAHRDMDASTFVRSLFALRRYFEAIALAGADGADFAALRELGIDAEAAMLEATGGVNTHRGAIFALGLLVATVANVSARNFVPVDRTLRRTLASLWGSALDAYETPEATSHGAIVAARHGAGGARREAREGFPSVFEIALPELRTTLARSQDRRRARVAALFALMANVADTNVLYRVGASGLSFVRDTARSYRRQGGVETDHDFERARALHREFVARGLSPGGCADLLAATLFVHAVQNYG